MKRHLSEAAVTKIMEHLLERFGEPIGDSRGDRQGVPSTGGKKKDMGNRGWGAKFEGAEPGTCDQCGGMMGMDQCCSNCGQMPSAMASPLAASASPAVDAAVVVVKGGPAGGGSAPAGKVAAGVHPPQNMDGIPQTGSGRGTQQVSKAAVPAPMPTEMPEPEPRPMPVEMDQCSMGMDQDEEVDECGMDEDDVAGAMDQGMATEMPASMDQGRQVRTLKKGDRGGKQ